MRHNIFHRFRFRQVWKETARNIFVFGNVPEHGWSHVWRCKSSTGNRIFMATSSSSLRLHLRRLTRTLAHPVRNDRRNVSTENSRLRCWSHNFHCIHFELHQHQNFCTVNRNLGEFWDVLVLHSCCTSRSSVCSFHLARDERKNFARH